MGLVPCGKRLLSLLSAFFVSELGCSLPGGLVLLFFLGGMSPCLQVAVYRIHLSRCMIGLICS